MSRQIDEGNTYHLNIEVLSVPAMNTFNANCEGVVSGSGVSICTVQDLLPLNLILDRVDGVLDRSYLNAFVQFSIIKRESKANTVSIRS